MPQFGAVPRSPQVISEIALFTLRDPHMEVDFRPHNGADGRMCH
jgi:hypothetical protein